VKSKKQLPPAKFQPETSANHSTILQPSYYSLNGVQDACMKGSLLLSSRENWPCSSGDGIVTESLLCSGRTLHLSGGCCQQPPGFGHVTGPRTSLPLNDQGERTAPDGSGAHTWYQRNGSRSIAPCNQITETSHSMALVRTPQAPGHELEYTSLLDDVLAVLQQDLTTQNNTTNPSLLGDVPNMQ